MSLLIEQIELLVLQHIQRQTQLQIEDAIKEIEQRQKQDLCLIVRCLNNNVASCLENSPIAPLPSVSEIIKDLRKTAEEVSTSNVRTILNEYADYK